MLIDHNNSSTSDYLVYGLLQDNLLKSWKLFTYFADEIKALYLVLQFFLLKITDIQDSSIFDLFLLNSSGKILYRKNPQCDEIDNVKLYNLVFQQVTQHQYKTNIIDKFKLSNTRLHNQEYVFLLFNTSYSYVLGHKIFSVHIYDISHTLCGFMYNHIRPNLAKEFKMHLMMFVHDIKNSLSGIHGFVSLIQKTTLLTPKQQKYMQYVQFGTRQIYDSIQKIDYNLKPIDLVFEQINLNHDIQHEIERLLPFLCNKNIQCYLTFENNTIFQVNADRRISTCCIRNIITNAIEHSPTNGSIYIQTNHKLIGHCKYVCISITNTANNQETLQLMQYTTQSFNSNPVSNKSGGFGIGLLHSDHIVQSHKGFIDIITNLYSTTISITIPTSL